MKTKKNNNKFSSTKLKSKKYTYKFNKTKLRLNSPNSTLLHITRTKKIVKDKVYNHSLGLITIDLDRNNPVSKTDFVKLRNPGVILSSTKYSARDINHRWILNAISVLPMINILHGKDPRHNYMEFVEMLLKLISNHGETEAMKRLKLYRLRLQQFVLDQNIIPISFLKKDLDGFPKIISFLKPSDKENLNEVRYALSLMRIIDLFKLEKDLNTNSITDLPDYNNYLILDILDFIKNDNNLLKSIEAKRINRLFLSNHAGPNGPATITAPHDLTALKDPKNAVLYKAINKQLVYDKSLIKMSVCEPRKGTYKDSKIIFLADKAGKTRQVAIADYWTNLALTSIHDTFMAALKNLSTDLTYDQDSLPKHLKRLGQNLYSSDLKSFTDRFPRILCKAVVEAVFDVGTAERWDTIVSDREFYIKETQCFVRYNTGTPMGLLSSWPVNTITHHIVKQYCAARFGRRGYKYLILGDDCLDTDKSIYNYYLKVMNELGVQISTTKCTVSNTGSTEFAKRLFYKSQEVTGMPINMLVNIENFPEQFLELVRLSRQRGYTDKLLGPRFVLLLSFLRKSIGKTVADVLSLPEAITGQAPLLEVCQGSYAEVCTSMKTEERNLYLELARKQIFWTEVNNISILPTRTKRHQSSFEIGALDPIMTSVTQKLLKYSEHSARIIKNKNNTVTGENRKSDADEYSIYNSWLKGEYQELCKLPSVETYSFKSLGHKITKCKYEVLKRMLLLIRTTNTNLFLTPCTKFSNKKLYMMGMSRFKIQTTEKLIKPKSKDDLRNIMKNFYMK